LEWSETKYQREIQLTINKVVAAKIEGHYLIEKRWIVKAYGWEVLKQPIDEVEGYKLMQDIYDRYENYKYKQLNKG
jgi:hypothetical protein